MRRFNGAKPSKFAQFNDERYAKDLAPILESDEFELTRLRRLASNLYSSAKVPVAAAAPTTPAPPTQARLLHLLMFPD